MSINRVVDVWDPDGYMIKSCVEYEGAYENAEKYLKALDALVALDGSVTLKSSAVDKLGKAIRDLMESSKQAIDDKSERLHTVEQQRKNLAEIRKANDEKKD